MHREAFACLLLATACVKGKEEEPDPFDDAADALVDSYCALAFSDGCSVAEDCGLPGLFSEGDDCVSRLAPALRGCSVPDAQLDAVLDRVDACIDALDTATCDEPLCGGGVLDSPPCTELFADVRDSCSFPGL